jgi:hypothetical protein
MQVRGFETVAAIYCPGGASKADAVGAEPESFGARGSSLNLPICVEWFSACRHGLARFVAVQNART